MRDPPGPAMAGAGHHPARAGPAAARPAGRAAGARAAGRRPALDHPDRARRHPGTLGRIGPITAAQARQLARAAATDPAAQWRVIVTNHLGQAIAVARIRRPRRRARDGPAVSRDGPPPGAGLVGRITVTITQDMITGRQHAGGPGPPGMLGGTVPPGGTDPPDPHGPLSPIAAAALRTAARALDQALAHAVADQAAGGCAHTDESPAYRPPPREREFVIARDVTCPQPGLPAAGLARRPGPHPGLRPRRPDLPLQHGWRLPRRPPAKTAPPVEARANPARHFPVDRPGWPDLHRRSRHLPHIAVAARPWSAGPRSASRVRRMRLAGRLARKARSGKVGQERQVRQKEGRSTGHGLGQPAALVAGARAAPVLG